MNIFEFIIFLILIIVCIGLSFYAGFGVGDSERRVVAKHNTIPVKTSKKQTKKEDLPSGAVSELISAAQAIENYDGKGKVI